MWEIYKIIHRWLLLGILFTLFIVFFYFHLYDYLTFSALKSYKHTIELWTNDHYLAAVVLYLLIFILTIACTIPSATFLTLVGGFLFGGIAFVYAMLGTTLGGLTLFLAIRTSIGERIAARKSGLLKYMEGGFQRNAFYYLLSLRLMPICPCWISNIAAGALNVPIRTFVVATVLGIAPATLIYVMVGRGLDQFFASDTMPNLNILFTPSIFLPLIALAILSIVPVLYKKFKKH